MVCKVCGCGVWDVCGVCTGGALVYNTTQLVALLPCHLSIVVCVHLCHVPTQAKAPSGWTHLCSVGINHVLLCVI